MNSLEKAVRPTLGPMLLGGAHGLPIILDIRQQTDLAAWALKTSILLTATLYKNQTAGYVPVDNLQWLKNNRGLGQLPPGTRVWLSCVDARKDELVAFIRQSAILTKDEEPIAHAGTFSVGYVVFQVFCRELTGDKTPPWRDSGFSLRGQFKRAMLDIWPARETASWPPQVHFDKKSILELPQRFEAEFVKSDPTVKMLQPPFTSINRSLQRK